MTNALASSSYYYFQHKETDKINSNCCHCGGLIHVTNEEAKARSSLRRYCQKCGKPNTIVFKWHLDVVSYPDGGLP